MKFDPAENQYVKDLLYFGIGKKKKTSPFPNICIGIGFALFFITLAMGYINLREKLGFMFFSSQLFVVLSFTAVITSKFYPVVSFKISPKFMDKSWMNYHFWLTNLALYAAFIFFSFGCLRDFSKSKYWFLSLGFYAGYSLVYMGISRDRLAKISEIDRLESRN